MAGFLNLFEGLSENERYCLNLLKEEEEYSLVKKFVKKKILGFVLRSFELGVFDDADYFQLVQLKDMGIDYGKVVESVNNKLKRKAELQHFKKFAERSFDIFAGIVAPNMTGIEDIKTAIALQLFAKDNLHILILADERVKKIDILESVMDVVPIGVSINPIKDSLIFSNFGLKNADNGMAAIYDVGSVKRNEKQYLMNAMDRGYVVYSVDDTEVKTNTNVSVLATATPIGGTFRRMNDNIRRQIPLDDKMMERFHLAFFLRDADVLWGNRATKKLANRIPLRKEDQDFLRNFVGYAKQIEVVFPREFEDHITEFIEHLKKREFEYSRDVNPRMVLALLRLAKASARIELRDRVEAKDVDRAKKILADSLRF
jgi:DNA replicative helicase MCM subunit Mcm2 (Cdc46/Mcm family)